MLFVVLSIIFSFCYFRCFHGPTTKNACWGSFSDFSIYQSIVMKFQYKKNIKSLCRKLYLEILFQIEAPLILESKIIKFSIQDKLMTHLEESQKQSSELFETVKHYGNNWCTDNQLSTHWSIDSVLQNQQGVIHFVTLDVKNVVNL